MTQESLNNILSIVENRFKNMLVVGTLIYLQLSQLCLVWEEEGEVRGEDAVLHVAEHLLVLLRPKLPEIIYWKAFKLNFNIFHIFNSLA